MGNDGNSQLQSWFIIWLFPLASVHWLQRCWGGANPYNEQAAREWGIALFSSDYTSRPIYMCDWAIIIGNTPATSLLFPISLFNYCCVIIFLRGCCSWFDWFSTPLRWTGEICIGNRWWEMMMMMRIPISDDFINGAGWCQPTSGARITIWKPNCCYTTFPYVRVCQTGLF